MNNTITEIERKTHVDKSTWKEGAWTNEPDKVHFVDNETGMDCLIVRGPSGALCGYVAVKDGHPAFNADYNRVQVEVHGGLTYANFCDEGGHICHVPRQGEPGHVYWLGFDCAHSGDITPGSSFSYYHDYGQYRDLDYVTRETQSLAQQLAKNEPLREPYDWETENV